MECLLSLCLCLPCGAPVPKHLGAEAKVSPKDSGASDEVPNNPTVPGFKWWWSDFELEVVSVIRTDGTVTGIVYRCVSHPGRVWDGCGDNGLSCQSLATTWAEVNTNVQRGRSVTDSFRPFTLVPP